MKSLQKKYLLFLLISMFVWAIVPMLRHSLPLDTQEALIWGKFCLWGTTKHPPLSGWVAWAFYNLVGGSDKLFYALSPLCVLVGLLGIYKLAKCFLPPLSALMATAFQLGIIFYTFSAVEFNVNVISVALWPWTTYFFWQAYKKDKLKNWLLFGIFMALNILNKYVGSVLGMALFAFVLINKKAWCVFKNPKAYLAGVVCAVLLIPHLMWLYDNNFEMLNYIGSRSFCWHRFYLLYPQALPFSYLLVRLTRHVFPRIRKKEFFCCAWGLFQPPFGWCQALFLETP